MRIDKFLKNSRIIKRRTIAKEACDGGRVEINGQKAKAGSEIEIGDQVKISFGSEPLVIRVLSLPESVKKGDAEKMYEILGEENE